MPQNLDYTKRSRTTEDEVLAAFRDRLRECPGLNDQNCFVSDQPIPATIPAGGGVCVTVSGGGGTFDQRMFAGHECLNEDSQIVVTAMININLDRIPQADRALLAPDRGLLRWKRRILRILLITDPELGVDSRAWEPSVGDRPLCRDQIRPLNASAPADVPDHPNWIGLHIPFSASFDWDLYRDE